jgi:hypothetical protein
LCALRILPEGWILDAVVQFIQSREGHIPVKDASSAASATA